MEQNSDKQVKDMGGGANCNIFALRSFHLCIVFRCLKPPVSFCLCF